MERNKSSPYAINTETVPQGVDIETAAMRNRIIEAFRTGTIDAVMAHHLLGKLYADTELLASADTRFYLADAAIEFPLEAGIDPTLAHDTWLEAQQ